MRRKGRVTGNETIVPAKGRGKGDTGTKTLITYRKQDRNQANADTESGRGVRGNRIGSRTNKRNHAWQRVGAETKGWVERK